jgi:flagellar basal-body rod protein FlgB
MENNLITNSPFSLEEKSLRVHEARAVTLSKNIANSSTPNFKAQDIDFRAALKQSLSASLTKTHANHLQLNSGSSGFNLEDRATTKESLDGNNVDADKERASFIENAIRYQASLAFTKRKAALLTKAIKGD